MFLTEQNTERQLQRLAAQRQLYGTAKAVFATQVIFGGPIAVLAAYFVLGFPAAKAFVALWGVTVALCDLFWLAPWQRRLRGRAAKIQEAFDCDVLGLQWNDVKAGKRPAPELIKEQADKYQTWGYRMPPLTDWYAPVASELPVHVGRIACQRSNCWWDAEQRRRYATWVVVTVVFVFSGLLWLALGNGFSIEDFLLKVAAPIAPAVLLGARQFTEQRDAAARLDSLRDHSERLWSDALAGRPEAELTTGSRNLQDEILENRRKSPLVFDAIFKRIRRDYEPLMQHGVAEYVAEAKQRLGIH